MRSSDFAGPNRLAIEQLVASTGSIYATSMSGDSSRGKRLTFFVNAYKTMNIVKRCSSNYNDEKEVVVLVVTQAHKVENPLCFCFFSSHTFSSSLPHDACDHVCGVYAHGVRVCDCHVYVRARGGAHEDDR